MMKKVKAKNVAAVERERERALFSKIKEGRNTFIYHIKKTESLNRNI